MENSTNLKKIEPKYIRCDKASVYFWTVDHYEPCNGKELGFNPYLFNSLSEMKNKYGFTNVLIGSENEKSEALNSGFTMNNIMAKIIINKNTGSYSYPSGNYSSYHLDEFCERYDFSLSLATSIANDVYPSTLLFSSWKKSNLFFQEDVVSQYKFILSATTNTQMICDQYHDESMFCGNDQVGHWIFFYANYGGSSRVKSFWISLYIDGEEGDYSHLLSSANSMGINKLWVYIGSKGKDYCDNGEKLSKSLYKYYLTAFLYDARKAGWLKQYDRKMRMYYVCLKPDPCTSCDQNNISESGGWKLDKIVATDIVEEWDESHWEETVQ